MSKAAEGEDLIVVTPKLNEEGVRFSVRHKPNHEIESGYVREAREGESADLRIRPHEDNPDTYRVVEDYRGDGPAKVSSNAYRKGWENIFGAKTAVGEA